MNALYITTTMPQGSLGLFISYSGFLFRVVSMSFSHNTVSDWFYVEVFL